MNVTASPYKIIATFILMHLSFCSYSSVIKNFNDTSIYTKINGNKGEGPLEFKGVRNLRPVLTGVLYRSGANNNYGPVISRSNDNPLSFQTLLNLYENGFRRAYYLYSSNFDKVGWPSMIPLLGDVGMDYVSLVPKNDSLAKIILTDVYHSITGDSSGAVLIHCWNGWHMSGLVSAYALIQFCDFSPDEAWEYWKACTDNNYTGFQKIRTRIFAFKSEEKLKITDEKKQQICPCSQ